MKAVVVDLRRDAKGRRGVERVEGDVGVEGRRTSDGSQLDVATGARHRVHDSGDVANRASRCDAEPEVRIDMQDAVTTGLRFQPWFDCQSIKLAPGTRQSAIAVDR